MIKPFNPLSTSCTKVVLHKDAKDDSVTEYREGIEQNTCMPPAARISLTKKIVSLRCRTISLLYVNITTKRE